MIPPPLKFGSIKLDAPVFLAPMAGYTDSAMRTLCMEMGAGGVYSELTSSEGLRRDAAATFFVLETAPNEHPIAGHLFGADPESMALAAQKVEAAGRFDWIDINCGCPVKKVVSRGAGAALLKDLPRMGQIIKAVKNAVSLPVSVKTRIGFNQASPSHLEVAKVVEESGADLLAVHARFAKNFHGGEADWTRLAEMKESIHIPLIGNGGIDQPEDVKRMLEQTGVDGVMIGRAAIGNPWIFRQIAGTGGKPTLAERREMVAEHLRRLVALNALKQKTLSRPVRYTPEQAACIQFRPHLPLYIRGLFNRKHLLRKLPELRTPESILDALDEVLAENHPPLNETILGAEK